MSVESHPDLKILWLGLCDACSQSPRGLLYGKVLKLGKWQVALLARMRKFLGVDTVSFEY